MTSINFLLCIQGAQNQSKNGQNSLPASQACAQRRIKAWKPYGKNNFVSGLLLVTVWKAKRTSKCSDWKQAFCNVIRVESQVENKLIDFLELGIRSNHFFRSLKPASKVILRPQLGFDKNYLAHRLLITTWSKSKLKRLEAKYKDSCS